MIFQQSSIRVYFAVWYGNLNGRTFSKWIQLFIRNKINENWQWGATPTNRPDIIEISPEILGK